jgi:hypothetical protein
MSTQTSDFPDWLNSTQQQNIVPYVDAENVARAGGTVTFGPFYVAQWSYLQVFCLSTDFTIGGIQYAFDSTFTVVVAELDFGTNANLQYSDVVPVIAPWVRLVITFNAAVPPVQTYVRLYPALTADPFKRALGRLYVMQGVGVVIAGSGSVTVGPLVVTTGQAQLAINTNANQWVANVQAVNTSGATIAQLCRLSSTIGGDTAEGFVFLPADPVTLTLFNNDAVARTFDYGLVLAR